MSNFWQNALGGQPEPPQQPPQPQGSAPASSRAWWRGDHPVTPVEAPGVPPNLRPEGHNVSRATHLKQDTNCPECGGGNVAVTGKQTTVNGMVEARRCFDCGWPLVQSTSGMSGLVTGKADGASRQLATGGLVNNYQPKNPIAGRLTTQADLR